MTRAAAPTDVVELARTLVRFDTSNPPGSERACLEFLARELERAGLEPRVFDTGTRATESDCASGWTAHSTSLAPSRSRRRRPGACSGVEASAVRGARHRGRAMGARRARHERRDRSTRCHARRTAHRRRTSSRRSSPRLDERRGDWKRPWCQVPRRRASGAVRRRALRAGGGWRLHTVDRRASLLSHSRMREAAMSPSSHDPGRGWSRFHGHARDGCRKDRTASRSHRPRATAQYT